MLDYMSGGIKVADEIQVCSSSVLIIGITLDYPGGPCAITRIVKSKRGTRNQENAREMLGEKDSTSTEGCEDRWGH